MSFLTSLTVKLLADQFCWMQFYGDGNPADEIGVDHRKAFTDFTGLQPVVSHSLSTREWQRSQSFLQNVACLTNHSSWSGSPMVQNAWLRMLISKWNFFRVQDTHWLKTSSRFLQLKFTCVNNKPASASSEIVPLSLLASCAKVFPSRIMIQSTK